MLFVCPKCKGKLNIYDGGTAKCDKGHSYDRSRYGYYNLLLSEGGGVHGDNKEMVLARREFLSKDFYKPLSERIAEIIFGLIDNGANILDAGCGEGYYTENIRAKCKEKCANIAVFDISKDAVREAAKRKCADEYAVAGSYHMPLADGDFDTVINTFSPLALEETLRVIKQGGYFIMAIPGEMHLFELKSAIYKTPYKNTVEDTALSGFSLISDESLTYNMHLDSPEAIKSLFMMTPYAYRTRLEDRIKVEKLETLDCTADFRIFVYRKD
jgi:23S rRNA (guanine745-N1)-methyltransferase